MAQFANLSANAPQPRAGFNFDLVNRNRFLTAAGMPAPTPMSTDTTICGVIFHGRRQELREDPLSSSRSTLTLT